MAHAELLELAMPANRPRVPSQPRSGSVGPVGTVGLLGRRPDLRRRVATLVESRGYELIAYDSTPIFLNSLRAREPDALLVDLEAEADDGTGLLAALRGSAYTTPVILMSGRADIPAIVRGIRAGAVDFLDDHCEDEALFAALLRAMDITRRSRESHTFEDEARARWHTVSPRERQVCRLVVQGRLNKQIAAALGTSVKTVKVHRAHAMTKMGARSLAELVHTIDRLGEGVALADAHQPAPRPPSPSARVNSRDEPPASPR